MQPPLVFDDAREVRPSLVRDPGCNKTIAITGATGFVGRAVAEHLAAAGHAIRSVSVRGPIPADTFAGCDAVIHLAGEPVAQRWTRAARERIRTSRVQGTRVVVEGLRLASQQGRVPPVLVSASAVGYYGSRGDDVLLESEPASADFLGQVALEWEREAMAAEDLGTRVARIRIGVVLGRDGGALGKMLLPFKLGLGGRIGSGEQWMSWIHLQDLVRLIEFLLQGSTVRGVFNAVAPNPATNAEFTRALAEALHRPAIIPVPAFALKLALGDMAQVLLASQRAIPDAAIRAGFTFKHTDIFASLAELVG